MDILITGATGFIGSALLRRLTYTKQLASHREERIWVLSSRQVPGFRCINHVGYTFTKDDLADAGLTHVDVIVHMGAATPHRANETGIEYAGRYAENVATTTYLFEHLPNAPEKIVFLSSTSVYAQAAIVAEDTPLGTSDIYGVSKVMCEQWLRGYANRNGSRLIICRLGPVYGEGEERRYSKVVSTFLIQLLEGRKIVLWGDGSSLRSNLYVNDLAAMLCEAVFHVQGGVTVNLCSAQAVPTKALARLCCDLVGVSYDQNVLFDGDKASRDLRFDTAKMQRLFKTSETPLADGVATVLEHLREGRGQ